MSNYWNLRCVDCKKDSETEINHGGHVLRGVLKAYPHIKAAKEADTSGYVEFSIMGYGDEAFGFLQEHDGHDVRVTDEYGHVDEPTESSAWPPCPDYDPNLLIPCEKWRVALEQQFVRAANTYLNNKGTKT